MSDQLSSPSMVSKLLQLPLTRKSFLLFALLLVGLGIMLCGVLSFLLLLLPVLPDVNRAAFLSQLLEFLRYLVLVLSSRGANVVG